MFALALSGSLCSSHPSGSRTRADGSAALACTSDLDCSLNGVCTGGSCACDKPWSGAACESMNFKATTFPQGYGMSPNVTTWGGGSIYDAATKKHKHRT